MNSGLYFILCLVLYIFLKDCTLTVATSSVTTFILADEVHNIFRRQAPTGKNVIWDDDKYYQITSIATHAGDKELANQFNAAFNATNVVLRNITTWNESITVQSKFSFFFYGHKVNKLAISTNGFIRILEKEHEPGPFSQYIAPFMSAKFGQPANRSVATDNGTDSGTVAPAAALSYVAGNTSIWVRWSNLPLMLDTGAELRLSFQCVIFMNDSMLFHYYDMPPNLSTQVPDAKAGVADVFNYVITSPASDESVWDVFIHRAENISLASITNSSFTQIVALPTCARLETCGHCMTRKYAPTFNCSWCFQQGNCSTDSQRRLVTSMRSGCRYPVNAQCQLDGPSWDSVARGVLGFFLALFIALLVGLIVFVFVYGYRRPDSNLGQCLLNTRRQIRDKILGAPRLPGAFYRASDSQVRLD